MVSDKEISHRTDRHAHLRDRGLLRLWDAHIQLCSHISSCEISHSVSRTNAEDGQRANICYATKCSSALGRPSSLHESDLAGLFAWLSVWDSINNSNSLLDSLCLGLVHSRYL